MGTTRVEELLAGSMIVGGALGRAVSFMAKQHGLSAAQKGRALEIFEGLIDSSYMAEMHFVLAVPFCLLGWVAKNGVDYWALLIAPGCAYIALMCVAYAVYIAIRRRMLNLEALCMGLPASFLQEAQ